MVLILLLLSLAQIASVPPPPAARELARDIYLVPGGTARSWTRGWVKDIASFLTTDAERREATEYANYYVGFLRKGAGASADCQAK